jgi:peptidoglycan/LPS O-acetylase OafA/YrhL
VSSAAESSAPERHVGALDGMRALAAFGVLATHVGFNTGRSLDSGPFAPFIARLDFGVTVFFLLSGFLLYRPFVASAVTNTPGPGVRRFYLRRALRILPAYWLAVVVTLTLLSNRPADRGDFSSYLLMVQTYNHHNLDPSLTQMWTLAVEVSFYAVLPVVAHLARGPWRGVDTAIRRQVAVLCLLVVIATTSHVLAHSTRLLGLDSLIWLPANLDWFAAGMALALLSCIPQTASTGRRILKTCREWAEAPGTCWVIGGLLFWLATLPLTGPRNLLVPTGWEWTLKHWLYAAAACAFLLPLMLSSGGPIGRFLSSKPMRLLGDLSYGVYLWHLPLLLSIQRGLHLRTFGGHFVELFVLTGAATTAVAALSWFGMERRLLRLGSRRTSSSGQLATTAPSTAAPHSS